MKQYPVFHGLIVFSLFGVLAGQISTGVLDGALALVGPTLPHIFNHWLNELLVLPLGADFSIFMVLVLGGVSAGWAHHSSATRTLIRERIQRAAAQRVQKQGAIA